ncbi:MAG: A24 family peptidase [Actinobacteria bacterium]|nr:A24 family peptidase [Actinomycetota bacterium]
MSILVLVGIGVVGLVVGSLLAAVAASWPSYSHLLDHWTYSETDSLLLRVAGMLPLLGTMMALLSRRFVPKPRRRVLLMELVTGSVYVVMGIKLGIHPFLLAYLSFFSGLVVLTEIDLEHQMIPKRIVYITLLLCAAILIIYSLYDGDISRIIIGAICGISAFSFFLLIHLIVPSGMGFGDVRLSGLIGGLLGWLRIEDVLAGIFSAFFLAGIIGLVLLVLPGKTRKTRIPFAPFLSAGAVVAVLWGPLLVRSWLHL